MGVEENWQHCVVVVRCFKRLTSQVNGANCSLSYKTKYMYNVCI